MIDSWEYFHFICRLMLVHHMTLFYFHCFMEIWATCENFWANASPPPPGKKNCLYPNESSKFKCQNCLPERSQWCQKNRSRFTNLSHTVTKVTDGKVCCYIDRYAIHLIPKWRPINYSLVCMLISPLCLVIMYKKQTNFDVKMRQRGLINMQTKE